jgi:Zn finger protein HypA/HybF involved in hydrogenase expression
MHEWGLVAEAASEVERQIGRAAVRAVTLRLGPGADDATVRTAWDTLTAGGPLSAAELVLIRGEHRMTCLDCGHDYPGQLPRQCPACGGDGLVTAAAPDLTVYGWVSAEHAPASPGRARAGSGTGPDRNGPDREQ